MKSSFIRNFTFGVEDSLASTVGLLSGIASANVASSTIIVTGLILVTTEALSMGIGSLLTEQSVTESKSHKTSSLNRSIPGAMVMFFSYFISGLLPISPYIFLKFPLSTVSSVSVSLVGLGILGVINARIAKLPLFNSVKRMVLLGGSVALVGVIAGVLLKNVN